MGRNVLRSWMVLIKWLLVLCLGDGFECCWIINVTPFEEVLHKSTCLHRIYKVTKTRGICGKGSGTGACFRTRRLKVLNSQEDRRKVKEKAPLMFLWPPTICHFVTFSNISSINVNKGVPSCTTHLFLQQTPLASGYDCSCNSRYLE